MDKKPFNVRGLRVVFFLNILRDGAGMVNRELGFAEALAKAGATVTVLSYFKPASIPAIEGLTFKRILPVKYYDFLYETGVGFCAAYLRVRRAFAQLKPDLVFVDLPHEASWAVRFRAALHYRVIFTYHGVANSAFYEGAVARALDQTRAAGHTQLQQVDRVLVVSDFLLAETESIGVSATRVHNGVDCRRFNPERKLNNITQSGPTVLFIGRYTEYKGALNVVRAFRRTLKQVPDAELIMHGYFESADYIQQIQAYVAQHNMTDHVKMFGPIDGREMAYRINLCSVFVNGSIDETFCMPLLEAQACGRPCVAFAAGGIPEVVADGTSGFLCPPEDVDAFGEKMAILLSDDVLRQKMGEQALVHAKQYTYDVLSRSLMDVLCDVMEAK